MPTIRDDTDSLSAVLFSLRGGMFRVRLGDVDIPGRRSGVVLDDEGNAIGTANDLIYGASGFSVHTRPFAGFVPASQIQFV